MRVVCLFLATVTLAGCGSNAAVQVAPVSSQSSVFSSSVSQVSMQSSAAANTDANTYLSYRDGVEGAGRPVLLFFYSPDTAADPFSQKTNALLAELYRSNSYILPTYRADFTTAVAVQRKYHVLLPDTIVLVDGEGNAVADQLHPTEADIKDFLTRFKAS